VESLPGDKESTESITASVKGCARTLGVLWYILELNEACCQTTNGVWRGGQDKAVSFGSRAACRVEVSGSGWALLGRRESIYLGPLRDRAREAF